MNLPKKQRLRPLLLLTNNWVYFGVGDDKDIDLILVCPTVDTLDEEFMSLENDVMKGYFAGTMEQAAASEQAA